MLSYRVPASEVTPSNVPTQFVNTLQGDWVQDAAGNIWWQQMATDEITEAVEFTYYVQPGGATGTPTPPLEPVTEAQLQYIPRCDDVNGDGSVLVDFYRVNVYDSDGNILSSTPQTANGTPYVIQGTEIACDDKSQALLEMIEQNTDDAAASLANIETTNSDIEVNTGNTDTNTGNSATSLANLETINANIETNTSNSADSLAVIEGLNTDIELNTDQAAVSLSNLEGVNADIETNTSNSAASLLNIEADTQSIDQNVEGRLGGSLINVEFDQYVPTYVAAGAALGELETVTYYLAAVQVAVITITYNANGEVIDVSRTA